MPPPSLTRPLHPRRSRRSRGSRLLAACSMALAGAALLLLAGCATGGEAASGGGAAPLDPDTAVSSGDTSEPGVPGRLPPAAPDGGAKGTAPDPGQPRACTEIGCESQLTFSGAKLSSLLGSARRLTVRACLDVRCESVTVEPRQCQTFALLGDGGKFACQRGTLTFKPLDPGDHTDLSRGRHTVSLRVTAADGTKLLDETMEGVGFSRVEPNGSGCPPVCFVATVRLRD
jgi:hypothetical protein